MKNLKNEEFEYCTITVTYVYCTGLDISSLPLAVEAMLVSHYTIARGILHVYFTPKLIFSLMILIRINNWMLRISRNEQALIHRGMSVKCSAQKNYLQNGKRKSSKYSKLFHTHQWTRIVFCPVRWIFIFRSRNKHRRQSLSVVRKMGLYFLKVCN